ncbi:hypothetical protein [Streptomyces sp. SCL15-6]|uniref:hypothetical protein n=1 Tax=Streptomyces sp. SCL15-6 TaxID=2967222 RepID=UPI0029672181|nr:hypothetical protein [Streptomyces sp. SCL15-6]
MGAAGVGELTVFEREGVYLVRRADEPLAVSFDHVDALPSEPGRHITVVVATAVEDDETDDLITALEPVRAGLPPAGTPLVHLVMAYGAAESDTTPSAARRLCEQWSVDVVAAAGAAVLVPGGSLFSPDEPSAQGGWWLFSPGHVPRRLGSRYPTPSWEGAVERLHDEVAEGYTARQVPAGVLLQPPEATHEDVDALHFAVPIDPAGPTLVIGVPGSPPVTPDAVASVLAALPGPVRRTVTLVPGDGRDALATGQDVADALGVGVRVGTGVPVLCTDDTAPAAPQRTLVMDPAQGPSWHPYVDVVTCLPAQDGVVPPPRLEVWRAPLPDATQAADPGTLLLDDNWQVVLTRSGMRIQRRGIPAPPYGHRPVDPQVMAVELGTPGMALDATAWPALESLFSGLPAGVRERVMLQVNGEHTAEDLQVLRRLAVRHDLALAPHGWRSSAPTATQALPVAGAPSPAAPRPVSAPVPLPASTVMSSTPAASPAAGAPAAVTAAPAVRSEPAPAPAPAPTAGLPATATRAATHTAAAAPPGPSTSPAPPAPPAPDELPAAGPDVRPPAPAQQPPRPLVTSSEPTVPAPRHGTPAAPGTDGPPAPGELPGPPPRSPTPPEARAPAGNTTTTASPSDGTLRAVAHPAAPRARSSSPAEHALLRVHLGGEWDRHVAAVHRALTHFPGLRAGSPGDEVLADLAAVHAYVNTGSRGRESTARVELTSGSPGHQAYLVSLASGLRRLPSYRGAALRVAGVFDDEVRLLLPGEEVGEPVPIGASPLDKGYGGLSRDHYLIWSVTGRRTDMLTDADDTAQHISVYFAPGTRFRVLRTRARGDATVMLLRELPLNAPPAVPGVLDDTDAQLAERLDALADQFSSRTDPPT